MEPIQRSRIAAANWKMHKTARETQAYFAALDTYQEYVQVRVYVPFTLLAVARASVAGREQIITIGAQNAHAEPSGAFTGEISLPMLEDVGIHAVLIGHSERRHIMGESEELVRQKTHAALAAGFDVCLCVGETREEREAARTNEVLSRQIHSALRDLPKPLAAYPRLSIAYEPVWAIGTGLTATPAIAELAHEHIRKELGRLDVTAAGAIPLLYGGSVKPDNTAGIIAMPNIDGVLVGGASLEPNVFCAIINAL